MSGKLKKRFFFRNIAIFAALCCLGAYLVSTTDYHVKLPLTFTTSGIPIVEIVVENKPYPVSIDTGSKFQLKLAPTVLNSIKKKPYKKKAQWQNLKGDSFSASQHIVPKINLGSKVFKNNVTTEYSFDPQVTLWQQEAHNTPSSHLDGKLGYNFFKGINVLFDIDNATLLLSNNLNKLKQEGYDISTFEKVPLIIVDKGLLVKVHTDVGPLLLIIDTGATVTLLKSKHLSKDQLTTTKYSMPSLTSQSFALGSYNSGPHDVYFLPMTSGIPVDGLLGIDFFKKHIVYLDLEHKTLYIKKNTLIK